MADREGNVLLPPSGVTQKAKQGGEEILASYSRLTQKGVTLETTASTVLPAGALLKKSGGAAKKYVWAAKADVANVVGILRQPSDVATADKLGNIVLAGVVKGAAVQYSDDTNGLSAGELATLATTLNGRYDATFDYLIF